MSEARKKLISIMYNGVEAGQILSPYLERFSYTDAVNESDKITLSLADRDLKWAKSWIPETGDVLLPSIHLENWNYEGEKITMICGSFIVDDYDFSAPPLMGNINGVSAPVNTSFKETENTKTWTAATLQLIAAELAGKYGLTLVYDVTADIQIAKMEQSNQADSSFLKSLCQKYGLGMKVYMDRLVIWDYKKYFSKTPVMKLSPSMVSKWNYKSTLQGTYTGARVSYTNPGTKKTVDVIVGTQERLHKTTQKADNEADAILIGEGAILNANRKATNIQLTLPPKLSLMATSTVQLSEFGKMDGLYFIEKVNHNIDRKAYNMQVHLSRILEAPIPKDPENESSLITGSYEIKKGDTLWKLAQNFYGDPSRCVDLYNANKEAIEKDAKLHGKSSSNAGYWIWPGLNLTIP